MATYSLRGKKVWVAGHRGMVGSAVIRRLESVDCEILTVAREDLDCMQQSEVSDWISDHRPDCMFIAAATVGGILANRDRPADFLYENLAIATNLINAAHRLSVSKLMFLGSSCIYPKAAAQPIDEAQLLTGPLEPTNEGYAIAKIAGIKLCDSFRRQHGSDFISVMPSSLYGPGDNFDPRESHVIPALLVRAHLAKLTGDDSLVLWGTGTPLREFLYVDDLADALIFLMENYSEEGALNIGSGSEISIGELAKMICDVVAFSGHLEYDTDKPDGTLRKLLDGHRLDDMGWHAKVELQDGLVATYQWYLENTASA